jgi:hypothetical protein
MSLLRPYETAKLVYGDLQRTSDKALLFAELTVAFLPGDGCMADNQNGIFHRSNHKRASYPRFMLVSKTECGDWLIIVVANPELGKAAFGWSHFHWCKSISHLAALSAEVSPNTNNIKGAARVGGRASDGGYGGSSAIQAALRS